MKTLIVSLIAAAAALLPTYLRADTRPNVVLIMIDTLRADKLGVYGCKFNTSPEIDAIAKQGAVFRRAISQAPWTRASIASLLTSQYPRSIGVLKEQWDTLPADATTLAEALKGAGYTTIGLTANPQINRTFNFHQGFDQYTDSGVIFRWMKKEEGKKKSSKHDRVASAAELLGEALKQAGAETKRPVYLQLLLMDVHAHDKMRREAVDPDLASDPRPRYLQTVRNTSREVGPFIAKLAALENFKNTLFVITADHGEGLADHPSVGQSAHHGNLLYESQLHVPLILFNPADNGLRGRVFDGDVRLLELVPTVLGYVGAAVPAGVEGKDLSAILHGMEKMPLLPAPISETRWRDVEKLAVYSPDYVYIENRDHWKGVNPKELQRRDRPQDGLKTDLYGGADDKVSAELQAALKKWEDSHPLRAGAAPDEQHQPLPEEVEQLKSLGYL
ncbi:MAG: sulfatase [Oligoflexia bacterium]|nr:sulfatase [Oligoflexia bacterium]